MTTYSYPWRDDPVEYLVGVKFPLEKSYRASFPSLGSMRPANRDDDYLKRASAYRKELGLLPRVELLALAETAATSVAQKAIAKRDAEEALRFFNQPDANTEIAHWSRMSVWSLDECVSLSLGKDPRKVNWGCVKDYTDISPFASRYRAQRQIIQSAKLAGQLWDSNLPTVFLAWAARMRVEVPPALVEAVKSLGLQIADWKTVYDAAEEHNRSLLERRDAEIKQLQGRIAELMKTPPMASTESPVLKVAKLGARERESLLKLVIGLAIICFNEREIRARSTVASEIADELQRLGIPLSDDTVRKYLAEARDLLPPPETEQKR